MESLNTATRLTGEGRYAQALDALNASTTRKDRHAADVLRAELLERTGRHGECRALLEQLLKTKELSGSHRSSCEFVFSRIEVETGNVEAALQHLQKSISLAAGAHDLERTCWAQLRLLSLVADRSGPESAAPLLSLVRSNVVKLGDPKVSAALHIAVGEMEGRRGLLGSAVRHTRLGQRILSTATHLWFESWAEIHLLGISILKSDFDDALRHGQRALELTEECGAVAARRGCFSNLGNLYYAHGQFDKAIEYLERAVACLPSTGEHGNIGLESIARVRLVQGRLEECGHLLDRIESAIQLPKDRALYVYRHSQLTRTHWLAHQQRWPEALESAEGVIALATSAGDYLLLNVAQITRAELLQHVGRVQEFLDALTSVVPHLDNHPPDVYAHYERALACALAGSGDVEAARPHFERARRIYQGLHNAPGLLDLTRCWDLALAAHSATGTPSPQPAPPAADDATRAARTVLENVAALMKHAGRAELLATGLVTLLADTGCVVGATAVSRAEDGSIEILASHGNATPGASSLGSPERTIVVGSARNRSVEIMLRPRSDIESAATLNAVALLLGTIRDLEQAHAEREERLTLWPIEEIPIGDDQAVVAGQMRELMSFASRVAKTNVSVLITGDSGTGKEILARAIHGYSARAQKPFVPFNCTAVPRDMLESQLFGHRRGAFTSADRDNPGLIRAARGGTLFLDEIGELGLDLQPKLLRFLESGEICPLGESSPFTVDVRVVAATNSDLERLVQDGRFREDLFYRLNVIRLTIPPLRERRDEIPALVHHFAARAAAEISKGHLRVAEETMEHLLLYAWPGNVRQLHNELRRMVALAEADAVLMPAALSQEILRATPKPSSQGNGGLELAVALNDKLMPTLSRIEREMIRVALRAHQGRVEAAAKALGISRKGLYLKRQRLGL